MHSYSILVVAAAASVQLTHVGAKGQPRARRETASDRIEKLLAARGSRKTTRAGRRLGSPKQMVDTAHPLLKARWEATGKLTLADIEAAAAPEWRTERAVRGRDRVSRLGSINDDRTAADCAAYTGSGAACFDGDLSSFDDDFTVALAPGACATCGYGETAPSGGLGNWFDCITCADAGDELMVLFDDCTGVCVDAAGKATLEASGFADLDDSACEATRACYDDDGFVDSLSLGGTNANYADDWSYSYSYDDDCTPGYEVIECRDDGTMGYKSGCDSCDCEMDDLTAASGGRYTCEPGTTTYYYDEDLDGNVDATSQFSECRYDDCSEDDEDDEDGHDHGDEDEDGDEDDDDCTPGFGVAECLDDGTFMYAGGCSSCDDCEMNDITANSGGRYTCDPGTNTYYYDEDLDGNADVESQFGDCWYDDCSDDDDDDEDGHDHGDVDEDGDEDDDDDCTPGFEVVECRDDGTVMQGFGCQSCDCATTHDLTAETDGRATCEPGTNTYYYDEDLDGNVDDEGEFNECWYDDCSEDDDDDDDDDGDDDGDDDDDDDECDIETSNDLNSSPSGTTNHGAGKGWCFSNLNNQISCTASPADCWERCSDGYGDDLVAIDWWDDGSCDCQNDCECMNEVGDGAGYIGYTVTRDSAVAALPVECGPTATPTPAPVSQATPSDGGGNGGADAASAGIIGGAVAGVAVIAAIAVGAYVYMRRAKDSADSAPMAEVEVLGTITGAVESGALKDAAPVPSAPPLMPPPPPTGRNFCSACGAPVQGPFCSACGARA